MYISYNPITRIQHHFIAVNLPTLLEVKCLPVVFSYLYDTDLKL